MPGRLKICSTITEPPTISRSCGPIEVTTGIIAFLSAWRIRMTRSRSPFAQEVLM